MIYQKGQWKQITLVTKLVYGSKQLGDIVVGEVNFLQKNWELKLKTIQQKNIPKRGTSLIWWRP